MLNLNHNNSYNQSNNCAYHNNRPLGDNVLNGQTNDNDSNDSPAMSNSPPPAPPPPPATVRGCNPRCMFSQMSTPTLARHNCSNPHLHANLSQHNSSYTLQSQDAYPGYDGGRLDDEEAQCPTLLERDFHGLHRQMSALRRAGVDPNSFRQHFYPDGGWGWIICAVAFLAHVLTTGFQLSYGFLLLYAIKHLGQEVAVETEWIGAGSWAMSLFSSTLVVALCRRKSTRLIAVIGGLLLALGILFTSLSTLFHQMAISYCVIVGVGSAFVRESSALMIGHYFKRRRTFVEMIVMSGEGVGIALFSVIIKEGLGKLGWRLGLQAVTVFISLSFFMGLLYRPASMYHPQRRAISHVKNQRKKMKEKKTHIRTPKPPFLDFSPLKSSSVRILCLTSAIGALGIYTPVFFLSIQGHRAGYDLQDLVLLQTFLGLSLASGIVSSGSSINKTCQLAFRKFIISRQYVCQGCVALVSISILILSTLSSNFHTLCIVTVFYGLGLGGYKYSLKMLALERVRGKYFSKAWGFIKGAESIPVLLSIPLTGYLNEASLSYGKAGYYICSAATSISAVLMFFIGFQEEPTQQNPSKFPHANGSIMSRYNNTTNDGRHSGYFHSPYTTTSNAGCSSLHRHYPQQYNQQYPAANGYQQQQQYFGGHGRLQKSLSFAFQTPQMMNDFSNNYYGCQNQTNPNHFSNYPAERCYSRCDMYNHSHQAPHQTTAPFYPVNGLHASRSRSVPEGLAHQHNDCHWNNNRTIGPNFYRTQSRPGVQVVEQITTSV